ncbi:MAG: hypothetical protein M1827_001420 [Pycnora praestabilis]|nr:MAG: hypothetical protein M1827_001420 [Pycnora praestabilis]
METPRDDNVHSEPHSNVSDGAEYQDLITTTHATSVTPNSTTALNPLLNGASHSPLSAPSRPLKTPFVHPLQISRPDPPHVLTDDQEAKYASLLQSVSAWTQVPNTSISPTAPITDSERMWLTRECLLRYLRAVKWNVAEAGKRLLGTLTWRREYGLESHTAEYISPENETGKQVLLGYDNAARPCLYLNPAKQNTKKSDKQIQHLVFMLERVIDLGVPGQEALTLLVNFKESSSGANASVGQGRQTLTILQMHYPERLGRALVINVPWAVWGFFKLITPFIDPLTREKLKFNEDLRQHVPPTQLINTYGGSVDFVYDHSTYWPALIGLADERRRLYRERWIKGGKRIGENEGYLKGGKEASVADTERMKTQGAEAPMRGA